jgi:hypothetical protein
MTAATNGSPNALGMAELQDLLGRTDPSALLLPPRMVRRVIKQHREIPGIGLQVPHRKTHVIARDTLLAIADREELGLPAGKELPPSVILLACPEAWLETHNRAQTLVRFWRLLFHARIDREVDAMLTEGRLPAAGGPASEERSLRNDEQGGVAAHAAEASLRERISRMGWTEFEEAWQVLRQEHFLVPPADLEVAFTEFVALFFELRYFARPLLYRYFPAIEEPERIEAVLGEIVDAEALFAATRLPEAPDPVVVAVHDIDAVDEEERETPPPPPATPSPARFRRLMAAADHAETRGNVIRAALLRTRAADLAPPEQVEETRKAALGDLDRMAGRLQAALELHDREAEEWRATLPALLVPAAHGLWPPSARLLYDLQKVCVDYERDIYAVDIVESFITWGARPVKRPVPLQADVLLVKHLRSATSRLGKAHISDEDRRRLGILLRSAVHHCEERLREKLRPRLYEALKEVGFHAENYPEEVARRKIVEGLLDRVAERGFLTMADVRDAIARNQLKLPDLSSPVTFFAGDPLIRLNRKLAVKMDGVYHRGEIYLRWLHRLSSLFFATPVGRWLSLYLVLPFGGAYAALIFVLELVHITQKIIAPAPAAKTPTVTVGGEALAESAPVHAHGFALDPGAQIATVGILGVLLLFLLHVPAFRESVWAGVKRCARGLRAVLIDWPMALLQLEPVRRFLASTPVMFFRRYLMRPALAAGLVALVVALAHIGLWATASAAGATFLVGLALFNSRLGRYVEDETADWLARNWYWLRVDVFPGLLSLILFFFREVLDRVERLIYTVDEWLRFRPGDSHLSLYYKPILGLIWFFMTYAIRVIINLFVEPTVNPIKHFPAVTVGAKLLAINLFFWGIAIQNFLAPIVGGGVAGFVAGMLVIWFPGVFGFAVWEFKENWRLYRANRSLSMRPVMIGHHGETMLRFMKPGFHSGTLPKLYARMRKAERRSNGRALHKHQEALHHIKESIRHFVERELLMLLEESKAWGTPRLHVGALQTACNRVRVELCCPELGEETVWVAFEEHSGWLVVAVTQRGWLERLSEGQRAAFAVALAGLYKKAGAALVRQQVEACLSAVGMSSYRVASPGLILWPDGDFSREVVCPLVRTLPAKGDPAPRAEDLPGLSADELLYSRAPITWSDWVAAWSADQAGQLPSLAVMEKVHLLPAMTGNRQHSEMLPDGNPASPTAGKTVGLAP